MASSSPEAEMRFDGRVAIVTGAGRGLGRAYAGLLAARGARVVVNDIDVGWTRDGDHAGSAALAEQAVAEIIAAGGTAVADAHSVSTSEGGAAIVQTALDTWGRIDIIVHNAGAGSRKSLIDELTDESLRRVVDTHLLGAFHVVRPAWRPMVAAGYGRLVMISSASSFGATHAYDYPAVKAGLVGLARSLAVDGAEHDIKANALMPMAYTRANASYPNEQIRAWLEQNFDVSQVAPAVAFLAHESVPCTGETLVVGGGRVGRLAWVASSGFDTGGAPLTVEDIAAHWKQIEDLAGAQVMRNARDELAMYTGERAWTGGGFSAGA